MGAKARPRDPDWHSRLCGRRWRSALLESEREIRARQIPWTRKPHRRTRRVLDVQPTALGLLPQVAGYILPGQDSFEVVGQENAAGSASACVVVHDPTLEPLIDEVLIAWVGLRPA